MKMRGGEELQQAKTRDKKIEITDIAISKANAPDIPRFSDEQNAKFKALHKELLKCSMEENDSNEVAFLFNSLDMNFLEEKYEANKKASDSKKVTA